MWARVLGRSSVSVWDIIRNVDRSKWGEEEQELRLSVKGGVGRRGSLCSELPRRGA